MTAPRSWRLKMRSARWVGIQVRAISNGGLDANWMTARGVPTVTLGCGQENPHTPAERLDCAEFRRACEIARKLAVG